MNAKKETLSNQSDIATKENDKGTELFKKSDIPETPFTLIEDTEENTFFVVLGQNRITEKFENSEDAIIEATQLNWNNITRLVWLSMEKFNELNNTKNK